MAFCCTLYELVNLGQSVEQQGLRNFVRFIHRLDKRRFLAQT